MVQAEVAARLGAGPGTRDYGPLAAALALAATVDRRRDFPPDVFWPRPKVRSSIVRIRPDPARRQAHASGPGGWPGLEAFLREAFHHRRKTLRQGLTLAGRPGPEVSRALASMGLAEDVRAEAVAPEVLAALHRRLEDEGGGEK